MNLKDFLDIVKEDVNDDKKTVKNLTRAITDVVHAIRSQQTTTSGNDRNYRTMSPELRPAAYKKAIAELKGAIAAAEKNPNFKYVKSYWRVLNNAVNEPLPVSPKETELSGFYMDVLKKIKKDNNYMEPQPNIGADVVDNPTDTAQQKARNAIAKYDFEGSKNIRAKADEDAFQKSLEAKAKKSEEDRENILQGKEATKDVELSQEDKKLKYGSGMNAGTATKIANSKIGKWEDLNTGFRTNYALIQDWKAKGIKPDAKHIFYRVGTIDGNPVCYLDGKFFVANRNWWAGTKAKATSIKFSEPAYASDNPPEDVKQKWLMIKPKASISECFNY